MLLAPERDLPGLLKLFADPTRLRILALVEREELSVGEVARALDMAQSRVSNHLRQLREAGLLTERHAGSSTHLRLAALEGARAGLWAAVSASLDTLPERHADLSRLAQVLSTRGGRDFFDSLAGDYDKLAGDFQTGRALERAGAALLPRNFTVADIGCGTGAMARPLLGLVDRIICVDRSEAMLTEARQRLGDSRTSVDFRQGSFESLPLDDAEVDGVVCGMVLHHLDDLAAPLREMARVLKPGARAVILELRPHGEAWMHEELGDRHLGLEPTDVVRALERAGFEQVVLDATPDRYRPTSPSGERVELPLYLVRATAPPSD